MADLKGYIAELNKLEGDVDKVNTANKQATIDLQKASSPDTGADTWWRKLIHYGAGTFPLDVSAMVPRAIEVSLEIQQRKEIDRIKSTIDINSWERKNILLGYMRAMSTDKSTSFIEFVKKGANSSTIKEEDMSYLQQWWESTRGIGIVVKPTPTAPTTAPTTVPKKDILESLGETKVAPAVNLDLLTESEILKSLKANYIPSAFAGVTDPNAILEIFGYDDIDQLIADNAKLLSEQALDVAKTAEAFRSGLKKFEVPPLSLLEIIKLVMAQPALAAFDLINLVNENFSEPVSAIAAAPLYDVATSMSRSLRKGEFVWNNYLTSHVVEQTSKGMDWWHALGSIYDLENVPGQPAWNAATRLMSVIGFDPINWVGTKALSSVAVKFPIIGRYVAGFNNAYIKATDDAVYGLVQFIRNKIPKTEGQLAAITANEAKGMLNSAITQATGEGNPARWTAKSISEIAKKARDTVAEHPELANTSYLARFGKMQLVTRAIDAEELTHLATQLGTEVPPVEKLVEINNIFGSMKIRGAGGGLTADETADSILVSMGVQATESNRVFVLDFLNRRVDDIENTINAVFSANSVPKIVKQFESHVENIMEFNLKSPVTDHMYKNSRISSFLNKVSDKTKSGFIGAIDRQLTIPMARQALQFPALGFWNVVESIFRAAFSGYNVIKDVFHAPSVVEAAKIIFAPYANAPRDIMDAVIRQEMDIVTEAGESALRAGGGENLPVLEWIYSKFPGLGRPISKKLPAPLQSMEMLTRKWGTMQEGGRASFSIQDFEVQFAKLAPKEYNAAVQFSNTLDSIGLKSFKPQDMKEFKWLATFSMCQGPDAVNARRFTQTGLQKAKRASLTDKMLAEHPSMNASFMNRIREDVVNGRALDSWDTLAEHATSWKATLRDHELFDTLRFARSINSYLKDLGQMPIKSVDDLNYAMMRVHDVVAQHTQNLSKLNTTLQHTVDDVTDAAARDAAHWEGQIRIGKYMDDVSADTKKYLDDLVERSKTPPDLITGYRSGLVKATSGSSATEGSGLYVGLGKDFVEDTWGNAQSVRYMKPKNPLTLSNSDELMILHESDELLKPVEPTDSLWTRFNKEAAKAAGTSDVNWNPGRISEELTRILKENGYDAVIVPESVGGTGASWSVLIDESLWKGFEAAKAGEKIGAEAIDITTAEPMMNIFRDQVLLNNSTRIKVSEIYQEHIVGKTGKARDKAWSVVKPLVQDAWNEHWKLAGDLELRYAQEYIKIAKNIPTQIPKFEGKLLVSHIAYLFGVDGSSFTRSILNASGDFTNKTIWINDIFAKAEAMAGKAGATADSIGFTKDAIGNCYDDIIRSMGIDPTAIDELSPKMLELQSIISEVNNIKSVSGIDPSDVGKLNGWIDGAVEFAKTNQVPNEIGEAAMAEVRKNMARTFTDYSDNNAVDAIMKKIYPFWNYEWQRWPWLAKTAITKPGVPLAWGSYMDYTDGGYIPIPFTDYEFNPMVGTVFMGGGGRMFRTDHPEYQDSMPLVSQILDNWSRFGFYPGGHIQIAMALWGAANPRKRPEMGETLVPWMSTGLDALIALAPDNKFVKLLSDIAFPDRWREYIIGLNLDAHGFKGSIIISKRSQGVPLTEVEQVAYDEAKKRSAIYSMLNTQGGGNIKYNPKARREGQKVARQLIADIIGIPEAAQEWIAQHQGITGKTVAHYIPLDPLQQQLVYVASGLNNFARATSMLEPSLQQDLTDRTSLYWHEVEQMDIAAKNTGYGGSLSFNEMDRRLQRFYSGEQTERMSFKEWISSVSSLKNRLAIAREERHNTPFFKDVAVRLEDTIRPDGTIEEGRLSYYKRNNIAVAFHPTQELLWQFYDFKPEMIEDPDLGWTADWDTYFMKTESVLQAIPDEYYPTFIENLHAKWSSNMEMFWAINRNYIRPYKQVRDTVMETYSPEEQSIIKRVQNAPLAERETLRTVLDEDGKKLIAHFEDKVNTTRRNLRLINPTLDAWLAITSNMTPLTDEARSIHDRISKDIGTGNIQQYIDLGKVKRPLSKSNK